MGVKQKALLFWSLGWVAMTVHMIQRWYEQVVVSTSYSYIIPNALIILIASMYMYVKIYIIHGWYGWYGIDQITCSKHLHVFITVPDLWLIGFQLRSKAQAVPGKLLRGQWPGGRHREGDYSHHEMWLLFIESRGPMHELSSMSMYITYDNKYHVSLYASSRKNEEFHSEAFSFKEQTKSSMCRFKQRWHTSKF